VPEGERDKVFATLRNNIEKVANYTVAGKAIGFAHEQPLHVVALACPASGILKQLEYYRPNLR
jgi:hypothetical protein